MDMVYFPLSVTFKGGNLNKKFEGLFSLKTFAIIFLHNFTL